MTYTFISSAVGITQTGDHKVASINDFVICLYNRKAFGHGFQTLRIDGAVEAFRQGEMRQIGKQ